MAAAIAAAVVLLGSVATAEAKNLGSTTLKPNASTFEALADLGVSVAPTGPAKVTNKGIAFRITGAKLDDDLTGKIKHKGGLKFESSSAMLKVKNFIIKIGNRKAKLFAFAGDAKIRLLDLDLNKAKVKNGGATVKGVRATLAKPAAEALSATFHAPDLTGAKVGKATVAFK
jgi:hypothetical protein